MPPKKKFLSGKQKKRRFCGNQHTRKDRKNASESSSESEGDKNHVESAGAAKPDNFKSYLPLFASLRGSLVIPLRITAAKMSLKLHLKDFVLWTFLCLLLSWNAFGAHFASKVMLSLRKCRS